MSDTPDVPESTDTPKLPQIQDGRYLDFKPVGQGGMGVVYLALDTHLGRRVALKVVRGAAGEPPKTPVGIEPPTSESPVSEAFAELESRFLREATITGAMEHPGVVPVYELGRTAGGVPYYTMRFVRGARTLRDAEHDAKDLSARLALLEPFLRVCDTVAYAHEQGVLHRDLKPENIALGGFGEVVVLDWGLAKAVGQDDEAPTTEWQARLSATSGSQETVAGVIGTPGYLAPELAKGDPSGASPRSDVYSLGVMLYQLLSGELPHPVLSIMDYLRALISDAPPPLEDVTEGVPTALAEICAGALAKDPDTRIDSARTLAARIRRWQAETVVERQRAERLAAAEAAVAMACPEPSGEDGERDAHPVSLADVDKAALAIERAREVGADAEALAPLEATLHVGRERAARARIERARRRASLRVAACAGLVLLLGAGIAAWLIEGKRREAVDARDQATAQRVRAEAASEQATARLADTYAEAAERHLEMKRHAAAMIAANESLAIRPSTRAWRALCQGTYGEPCPDSRALASGIQSRSLAVSPDGTTLAVGGAWGQIALYDLASGKTRGQLQGAQGQVSDLAFLGPLTLRGASHDGTVRTWRIDTMSATEVRAGPPVHLRAQLTLDDGTVMAGTSHGRVLVWPPAAQSRVPEGRSSEAPPAEGPVYDFVLRADATHSAAVTQLVRAGPMGVVALQEDGYATPLLQDETHTWRSVVDDPGATDEPRFRCIAASDRHGLWAATWDGRLLQRMTTELGERRAGSVVNSRRLRPLPDGHTTLAMDIAEDTACLLRSDGTLLVLAITGAPEARVIPLPHAHGPAASGGGDQLASEARHAVQFLPDGRRLAVTDPLGRVLLFDVAEPAPAGDTAIAALVGHGSSLTGLALRSEGRGLLSCAKDGLLIRWDGEALDPRDPQRLGFGPFGIGALTYDPARDHAVMWMGAPATGTTPAGQTYRLMAVHAETGATQWEHPSASPPPFTHAMAVHQDVLYLCMAGQGLERRDLATGTRLDAWAVPGIAVPLACTVRAGDGLVAVAGPGPSGGAYAVMVRGQGDSTWTSLAGTSATAITALAVTASPSRVFALTSDGRVGVYSLDQPTEPPQWLEVGEGAFALLADKDEARLYVGGHHIHVYDLATLTRLARWDGHLGSVSALRMNESGDQLVSAGFDGSLRVWRQRARPVSERLPQPAGIVATARGADAHDVLVLGQDGSVRRLDALTGRVQQTYTIPRTSPAPVLTGALTLAPDRTRFAVVADGADVTVFALESATPLHHWRGARNDVASLCFDREGDALLLGTALSTRLLPAMRVPLMAARMYDVLLWPLDGSAKEPTERWPAHTTGVRTLYRSQDGHVFSGGDDGRVRSWSDTGPVGERPEVPHHVRPVVAFVERGGELLSMGAEGRIAHVRAAAGGSRSPATEGFAPAAASVDGRLGHRAFYVLQPAEPFGWNTEVWLRTVQDDEAFDASYVIPHWGSGIGNAMLLHGGTQLVLAPSAAMRPGRALRRVDLTFLRMNPSERRVLLEQRYGLHMHRGAVVPRFAGAFVARGPGIFR